MTLALAFVGKDGIVMATDSAKTYLDDAGKFARVVSTQKLYKLGKFTGLAVVSEQAGVSEWMIHQFEPKMQLVKVDTAKLSYDDTIEFFTQYAKTYLGTYTKDMPLSALRDPRAQMLFVLGGYDVKGEPSIIQSVSSSVPTAFAPDVVDNHCALGCAEEAWYWARQMEQQHLDTRQMSVKSLGRLCLFLIRETSKRWPTFDLPPASSTTAS